MILPLHVSALIVFENMFFMNFNSKSTQYLTFVQIPEEVYAPQLITTGYESELSSQIQSSDKCLHFIVLVKLWFFRLYIS